nr:ABC transporter ATP-binding protein [bacterium]
MARLGDGLFWKLVKKRLPMYLIGLVFLLVSSYLQVLNPRFMGQVIDQLSVQDIVLPAVTHTIWLLFLAAFGAFATKFIWRYYLIGAARKVECELREMLFAKLQRLSPRFFHERKTGDLMAYAINDINAVRMTFGPALAQLVSGLSLGAIAIYNMVAFGDKRLVLGSLIPIIAAIAAIVYLGTHIRARFKRVQESFSTVSDHMQESISGIRVVKAYVQEGSEAARFSALNEDMYQANIRMVRVSALLSPCIQVCFGLSFAFSLIFGGRLVQQGKLSLGDFVAFQGYLTAIVSPVTMIGRIINLYQRGLASWHRLAEIFHYPEDIQNAPPQLLSDKPVEGEISFEHLSFTFPDGGGEVLKDINLTIHKGETIGILGRTGSGKSALMHLILRHYNAPEGTLKIDGVPIEHVPVEVLREAIGYVPQDGFLFSASIRDNLTMYAPPEQEEVLERAVAISQMADTIAELPDGYDTMLGERGVNLSGGQQQRLAIARALARRPKILILDDALSSVDTRTEEAILNGLKPILDTTTAIIIAHRVSAVRGANRILFMDHGEIAEMGTHEQLMRKKGLYYELYTRQMQEEGGQGA